MQELKAQRSGDTKHGKIKENRKQAGKKTDKLLHFDFNNIQIYTDRDSKSVGTTWDLYSETVKSFSWKEHFYMSTFMNFL